MSVPDGVLSVPLPILEDPFGFPPWEPEPEPAPAEQTLTPADERRRRRMISNRESARRSRMRKQQHLEDLRCRLNRFKAENRNLAARLDAVSHYCHLFRRDNDRLRSESAALRRRLLDIRRHLLFLQLQKLASASPLHAACGGFGPGTLAGGFSTAGTELNTSSLIV